MSLSQKINRFCFVAALAAIISLNGCDTSEDGPLDTTPHPSFSANINGEAWTSTGPEADDNRMYAMPIVVGKLEIFAFRTIDGKTDVLNLRISSPQTGVNILMPPLDQQEQTASYTPAGSQVKYYMTNADSGAVTLDHYDETTTRISGSFWFTASNNPGQPVAVTSGTFKDVIVRK